LCGRAKVGEEARIRSVAIQHDLYAVAREERRSCQRGDREIECRLCRRHRRAIRADRAHSTHRCATRKEKQSDDGRDDHDRVEELVEEMSAARDVVEHGR